MITKEQSNFIKGTLIDVIKRCSDKENSEYDYATIFRAIEALALFEKTVCYPED